MQQIKLSIPEQIKKAMDGRTQRWLSFEVRIPEIDLSKKINEVEGFKFTEEELVRIEQRLNFVIDRD